MIQKYVIYFEYNNVVTTWDVYLTLFSHYPFIYMIFQVEESQIIEDLSMDHVPDLKHKVKIYHDAYSATKNTHAIVLCTEWDEFMVLI